MLQKWTEERVVFQYMANKKLGKAMKSVFTKERYCEAKTCSIKKINIILTL